jgi:hypothetical protein
LKVDEQVFYNWIKQGVVTARKVASSTPYWINLDPEKEQELRKRLLNIKNTGGAI